MNSLRDKVKDAVRSQLIDSKLIDRDDKSEHADLIANIADDVFIVLGVLPEDQDKPELMINILVRGGVAYIERKTSGFSVSLIDYDGEGDPQEIKQEWSTEEREGVDVNPQESN